MASRKYLWISGLAALAVAGGWWFFGRGRAHASPDSARISVRLRGRYPGSMVLPATINWCPVTRVGVLEAVSGDSGIAVVLYERDSITAGPHAVVGSDAAAAGAKPAATMVMRWMHLSPDTAVSGFRAETGTVRMQMVRGVASGDINVRMRSYTGSDTLQVQGTFTAVPVVTSAKGCT